MRITVKQIMSLSQHGASCTLLIFDNSIKILLDCGINNSMDFSYYERNQAQFNNIQIALISHSAIEYSGAFIFLVQKFGIDPKIFHTTQPIMRYSPLNFHQEIISHRLPQYDKKVFNKIYSVYQEIQLVKPYQKIYLEAQSNIDSQKEIASQTLLGSNSKTLIFSCSLGGGSLGSVAWRINFGLLNVVYLVQFNNFSLYHLNGIDLQYLRQKNIDVLLTDCYLPQKEEQMRKDWLFGQLKQIFDIFNQINPFHQPLGFAIPPGNQKKLLITCYPNQLLIQVMQIMKMILSQFHQGVPRQKIKVIHLSSRYIQLVKSQIQYFSEEFKSSIDKIDDFFVHSRKILPRINIAPISALNGLLNQQIVNDIENISIYHVGQPIEKQFSRKVSLQSPKQFLSKLKIFNPDHPTFEKKQSNFAKQQVKLQASQPHPNMQIQHQSKSNYQMEEQLKDEEQAIIAPQLQSNAKALHGKFISEIGFPHFARRKKQSNDQFDQYGLKFRQEEGTRIKSRQIGQASLISELNQFTTNLKNLQKKKSTIEVMNMQFDIPLKFKPIQLERLDLKCLGRRATRTNLASSVQVTKILKPRNIVYLNTQARDGKFECYKKAVGLLSEEIKLYELSSKRVVHIEQQNQLMQYKINIAERSSLNIEKVKGRIEYSHGAIHIHLEPSGQKQIQEFRLEILFKRIKNKIKCQFVGEGIRIEGVRLYKRGNQVVLEGHYSEEYFKVRSLLYQFLQIR